MTILSQDTFTRLDVASSSWGKGTDGETWAHSRGTSTLDVTSGHGRVTFASSTADVMTLGPGKVADAEVVVRFLVVAGGDLAGPVLRFQDSNNWYCCIVGNTTNTLTFRKDVASTFSTVGSAISFTYSSNAWYWIRFRIQGTALSAKVWADGSTEPPSWMMTATDSSLSSGQYGICASPATTGNIDQFDHFTVTDLAASLYPRYVPRGLGSTIIPDMVSQPLPYIDHGMLATIVYEDRTFIPRALGGVYIPDTVLWVPRAFGGTTSLPLATATTYTFTDALSADDSFFVTESAIPLDALSSAEILLTSTGSMYTETNAASDSLGGGGTGTFTDGLLTSDNLLESEAFIPLDANTVSDALLKVDGYLPLDALTASDTLLGTNPYLPLDGLTGATMPLEWDIYLPTDDGLSASDSSSMTQVPPGGGPANNTYSFTDALVASDALVTSLVDVPLDGMAAADALVCSAGASLIDALSASDMGGMTRGFVDALSISDTLVQSDIYLPTEVQNVLESVVAGDNTLWVDALSASDTFTALIVSAQPLQYINVTWVTRDMSATWTTRDGKATWTTRDDKAGWNTRDDQASWKTRDDLVTWKTRR